MSTQLLIACVGDGSDGHPTGTAAALIGYPVTPQPLSCYGAACRDVNIQVNATNFTRSRWRDSISASKPKATSPNHLGSLAAITEYSE